MASQERIDNHHCHARGCKTKVPPEMLMCKDHWKMVPKSIQRRVWATYRPGQCDDMNPSGEWHEAADDAINAVALAEAEKLSFASKPYRICAKCRKVLNGEDRHVLTPDGTGCLLITNLRDP